MIGKGTRKCGRMAGTGGDTAKNGQGLPWCWQSMVFTQPGEFQEAFGLPEASLGTLCSRNPAWPWELSSPSFHSHSKRGEQWDPSCWDGAPKAVLLPFQEAPAPSRPQV